MGRTARGVRPTLTNLGKQLEALTDDAYRLNVLMMTWLRDGTAGRQARRPLEADEP